MIKTISVTKDTLRLEKVAISDVQFKVTNTKGILIPSSYYYFNPQKAQLFFYSDSIKLAKIHYYKYPDFLTQTYSPFQKKLIIPKATPNSKPVSILSEFRKKDFFGEVATYGNITRGITVGNNQGSVLNSGLDLQITGSLSEKLKIRASIKDSNVPIQENGVSQNLREFDRVFIELFTDTWKLKAGDVDLQNRESYFLNFNKKINGAQLNVMLDNGEQQTTVTASGAVVRGKFTTAAIHPQEGNQGPYRLLGANGELNIVVISGSEVVYVNGVVLKRGEQHDYTIDYTTAEITFNPTFPINAAQRILVDYQYSDQNYNRFVTHNGIQYKDDKWSLGTYFYHEHDVKSQSLQQNLNDAQKQVLKEAGNNLSLMVAESANKAAYDENRIQYTKNADGNYVRSNNKEDELYNVVFNRVANGQGAYNLQQTSAQGNVYVFVGENNGSYAPVTQLIAPVKTQVAVVNTGYQISKSSFVHTELAYSNNDLNLFSDKDDNNNQGLASKLTWKQKIATGNWNTENELNWDFVQKNFNNIEGLYQAEFNRDWNLEVQLMPNFLGNQTYIKNQFTTSKQEYQKMELESEYLKLGTAFKGIRNSLITNNTFKNIVLATRSSFLNSKNKLDKGVFVRNHTQVTYPFAKGWMRGLFLYEDNQQKNQETKELHVNNQKYTTGGLEFGLGDSTKVFTRIKYYVTEIDSVKNNKMTRVQNAQNYSVQSKWIENEQTSWSTFANYRVVANYFADDVEVVNASTQFSQRLFQNLLVLSSLYQTSSGTTPQQNYNYIETEPGQGFYTYLGDLNDNGIKDFDEFEVAQFADQANYLRVLLPTLARIATQKAKFSQSLYLNFIQFKNHTAPWLRWLSHFSTQTGFLIDKDQLKVGRQFNINPFATGNQNVVGLQKNVASSLFFNRGQQHYSSTYTYINNENRQIISADAQTASVQAHEFNFQHNIQGSWVLSALARIEENSNKSSFESRNFAIHSQKLHPSISFLKDEFSTVEAVYIYQHKKNEGGDETLASHDIGLNYNYNHPKKGSVLASVHTINNQYQGALNSPASYRMLEGLPPDRNYTWSVTIQKSLTRLLDLSLSYNGRKNNSIATIHIGSVQLRANF
ncbi:hypothetical protein [Ochrovirga pacifica]|uniref:hypothetical protein n=1 Tax=Ochrovirga pacifica TaxID=1042376 RepID=UPI00025594E7|nr:hypothetical protein [Ochrovirga pacifica]